MKRLYLLLLVFLVAMFSYQAKAQSRLVEGTVLSATDGLPLVGATVVVKGTTKGTTTNLDGEFSIEISEPEILVASFIGFASQEIAVNPDDSGDITFNLTEDIAKLNEVVVSGLASTVKRSNLANAVATVDAEELTGKTTQQTLDNALYGKLPGVNMNANSGAPGGGVNIQLRGISTLGAGSSQPLYIIDGVYVDNSSIRTGRTQVSGASGGQSAATQDNAANRIADIDPEDIERIEVLKGPSAAAIYGTRANAGVILITTKKGSKGKPKIRISQDIGFAQGQNFVGLDDWNPEKITAYYGTGQTAQDELAKYNEALAEGRITDWEEELYGRTALLLKSTASITGGFDKTKYYVSAGIQDEEGIIENTGFERYSIRANVEQKIGDDLTISLNNNYVKSESNRGFTGNQNNTGGSLGYNIAYTPTYADLFPNELGNYPTNTYFNDNPLAIRDLATNNSVVDRYITSFALNWDIFTSDRQFLKFSINGGVDYLSSNSLVHFPEILQHQQANNNPGDVMWGKQDNLNTNVQGFLIYNAYLGSLNTNTQVGLVRLDNYSEFLLARGRGLVGGQTNLRWANVQSVQDQVTTDVTDFGIVAQEELNWEEKIIGTVGIRLDKSTLNYQQNEFYAFPKASVAVNIHNFDFWAFESVNQLKLRAAYGETGGLPTFGNTFESLTPQLVGGELGGQVGTRGVDPNLVPETASELEVGVDFALFDNKIGVEATYYNKEVRDLILDLQPAEATGILAIATNAADLVNKGIELTLNYNPVTNENFVWNGQLLWWRNRSEITRLDIPTFTTGGFGPSLGSYLIAEGYSPTTIVGNPATTDVPGGFTVYGDRQADFNMSFYNSFTFFKNFDLSFLFHWKQGGENINLSSLLWDDGGTTPGWDEDKNNNETPDGLDRLLEWAGGNTGVYVQDASYLKLRELGLYYRVPSSTLSSVVGGSISKLKIGASLNNVLLWTPYESYDPEVSNFGSQPIASNIEVSPYPSSRRVFFHIKFEF